MAKGRKMSCLSSFAGGEYVERRFQNAFCRNCRSGPLTGYGRRTGSATQSHPGPAIAFRYFSTGPRDGPKRAAEQTGVGESTEAIAAPAAQPGCGSRRPEHALYRRDAGN